MKSLQQYLSESLITETSYKYRPKTKEELYEIIKQRIKQEGNEVDLNDIDLSKITDISYLFSGTDFNGDISKWDVSKVKYSTNMFLKCPVEEKYKPHFK